MHDTSPLNYFLIGHSDLLQKGATDYNENDRKIHSFVVLDFNERTKAITNEKFINSHKTDLKKKPMSITYVSVHVKQMYFNENTIKTLITIVKSTKLVFIHN